MAVGLLCVCMGGCVAVGYFLVSLPVFKLAHVFHILFQVSDGPAVGTKKVWPCGPIEDGTNALVVPDV